MAHGITAIDTMFSVRKMPWHGLGAVLDAPPADVSDALTKSGLGWTVEPRPLWTPAGDELPPLELPDHVANVRTDTNTVLGVVGANYQLVQNGEAFAFLDAVLGSELHFETAGSLWGGRRVWVLARTPEFVEVAGDQTATYVFVANSHDGTLSVTAAVTPIRIVCANTLGWALRNAARTFKFKHTTGLGRKWEEARQVMGLTVNYEARFKELGDELGRAKLSAERFDKRVLRELFPADDPTAGGRAAANREEARAAIMAIFRGQGVAGDTTGNAPGTKWAAANAIAEYADWGRRTTKTTNQVFRSFEDGTLKQRGLAAVLAA